MLLRPGDGELVRFVVSLRVGDVAGVRGGKPYPLQQVSLFQSCFKHCSCEDDELDIFIPIFQKPVTTGARRTFGNSAVRDTGIAGQREMAEERVYGIS